LITGSSSNDAENGSFPRHGQGGCVFDAAFLWENHSAISKPPNAMLMRKDMIAAFHDNAFGIDVDVRPSFTPSLTSITSIMTHMATLLLTIPNMLLRRL